MSNFHGSGLNKHAVALIMINLIKPLTLRLTTYARVWWFGIEALKRKLRLRMIIE